MKATEASLLQFLKKSPQFVIPIYQRTYSWTDKECAQLWTDILRAGRDAASHAHFVGSVVYVEKGLSQVSSQSPLLVIDGQQRLTTVMLLLEALSRQLGENEPVEGFSAKKIRNYYLLNPLEEGDKEFKLLLTQTDRETLTSLVKERPLPKEKSVRVEENFVRFTAQLKKSQDDLAAVCSGLSKLIIVDVALNRDHDNPQLIFESMNSTGRALSQADLIRNYVLMGLEPRRQTDLYEQHWRPMETSFGQENYTSYFDAFMRYYLTVKTGELPNVRAVYDAFKGYARRFTQGDSTTEMLVADLQQYAKYYCAMALGQEKDAILAAAFQDLRDLTVDVAYPLLLELYHDYENGALSRDDFHSALRLIESYVFRRAVCGIPTNVLNKSFAVFARSLDKSRYLESMQATLLLLPSYRRFPDDEEFCGELTTRDVYNFPRRSYLLRRLENHHRKERIAVNEYTIEHIMPQNPALSAEWQAELGENWEHVQKTWLHTLGNLTLTGYNSEYGDRPFAAKRDMVGGFKESVLRLNEGLGTVQHWDESAIQERGSRLATLASRVWVYPTLNEDVLARHRSQVSGARAEYSIDSHRHLALGKHARVLFEALRGQLLDLDPSVTEEFRAKYVAYKAVTNVVDIVPKDKRLLLHLNMPFPDLVDPRGVARDMTGVGHWGNGDVEVTLEQTSDIPYALGLIRQALERQLGD